MAAVAVRHVLTAMSAAIATANAHHDKVIALRMGTKDRNTQESAQSFPMSVLVFQASVPLETATVIRVSDHPDNLTTAVLVQKVTAHRVTMSRVHRARSKTERRVIMMLAHSTTTMTMISNPAPMRT